MFALQAFMFCVLHCMYLLCIDLSPLEWFMMPPPLLLSVTHIFIISDLVRSVQLCVVTRTASLCLTF